MISPEYLGAWLIVMGFICIAAGVEHWIDLRRIRLERERRSS